MEDDWENLCGINWEPNLPSLRKVATLQPINWWEQDCLDPSFEWDWRVYILGYNNMIKWDRSTTRFWIEYITNQLGYGFLPNLILDMIIFYFRQSIFGIHFEKQLLKIEENPLPITITMTMKYDSVLSEDDDWDDSWS